MRKKVVIVDHREEGFELEKKVFLSEDTEVSICMPRNENEPLDPHSELLALNNVVLTPHVAWYTEESIVNLHQEVIDDVLRVLRGNTPKNVFN